MNLEPIISKFNNDLIIALITNFGFSIIIFIVSKFIFSIKEVEKNILGLKNYGVVSIFKYSIGSVLVCFVLLICNLIVNNIITLLIVAFVWDNIFIKLHKSANDNNDVDLSKNICA